MLLKFFQNTKAVIWLGVILAFLIILATLSSCLLSNQTGESSDISQPGSASPLSSETSSATRTVVNTGSTSSAIADTSTTGTVSNTTSTPENVNTPVPPGVFTLIFYPPFVMNYEVQSWTDKSEYDNFNITINHLQHQKLEACTIGVQGPSGFYPEDMKTVTLGKIVYQVFTQESSGKINTFYFAQNTTTPEGSIPILIVQSDALEADECKAEAEKVLASLN
jgi:hypothetical protein